MEALLLLTLLAQTPAPPPPKSIYVPPDPVQPLPIRSLEPDQQSLCHLWFGDSILVCFGPDPCMYLFVTETEKTQASVVLSRDGLGVAWMVYLGRGVRFRGELRTLLFRGTALVSLDWFPIDAASVSLNLDLHRGFLPLDRTELLDVGQEVAKYIYTTSFAVLGTRDPHPPRSSAR